MGLPVGVGLVVFGGCSWKCAASGGWWHGETCAAYGSNCPVWYEEPLSWSTVYLTLVVIEKVDLNPISLHRS